MPDDFDASTLTTGTVAVGGSATGNIDTIGDQDWFAVSLIEGQSYEISVYGLYADDLNSLPDPFLRGLYDSAGLLIVGAESDDADIETRSGSTTFTATSSGTFFISASAYNVGTGAYSVSVTDLGPFDDFSSDVTTTGMVLPDSFALGEFEFQGDTDWFEIELVSGVRYLFELYGSGTGTWADAPDLILNPLRDANGNVITNSGEEEGENPGFISDPVESFFEYVPTYTGTHYVDASTHLLFTGRYQLNVTDLGYSDDFSDDSLTTGFLPLNGSIMGMIEADMDRDWFAVSLVAGETYDINVLGAETFDGTLDFPLLHYIVDPFGEYIPYSFNAEGSGDNATLSYLATTTGTHYIEVAAYDGHTGSYTLTIDEALLFDDWGNNHSSDGALPINSVVGGDINYLGDEDFFRVALTAGTVYQFDLNAFGFVNPLINGIYSYAWDFYYDHPDNLIPGTVNNDFGGGLDSRVIFTAPTTGDYFVSAAAAGGALGGYSLSLLEIGFATDDFAGDLSTLGTLALGGSVGGINETEDDEDWFAITLDAAHTYRFSFMGEDSYLSDFSMPSLRVLDDLGNEAFSAISETSSYNSADVTFAPIASGTYFIAVGDDLALNGTGSYTLNAEDLGPVDDFAADISTTGAFFVDGMATTYAMGTLETSGDEDWFAISLTAGNTYEINLKGAETGVGTLDDPFFVGIYNAAGSFIDPLGNMLGFSDDDSGEGLNSFTRFIPTYTGTHFFAVAGPDDEGDPTGTYVVQVDDLGVDALISEEINEGETIDFALEYENIGFDRALVVTSSVLSVSFSGAAVFDSGMASDPDFSLTGNTTDRFLNLEFTALDDDLVEDDEDVRITTNGFVDWVRPTADGSGAVFTNIDGGSVTGVLERATIAENIYLDINSAPEGVPTDITGFSFDQPEIIGNVLTNFTDGSGELFTVVPTSFSGTVTGDITANGDIFLSESIAAPGAIVELNFTVIDTRGALTQSSQRITFSEEMDDFLPGNAATEFGSLIINTPSLGSIEQLSDRDRFVVDLTAGHSYVINLVSSDLSGPALTDPEIYGLFDPLGALVPGTSDNDSGIGFHAFVNRFSVDTSGQYAIEAGAFQDGSTGDYSLSISTIDDFLPSTGADVAAAQFGSLAVDGIAGGQFDFAGDLDRFQMSLVAGDFYSLMVTSDTGLGDPELVGVFDSLGQFVTGTADTDDDPTPDGTVPLFSVPTTGLYDLEIGSLVPEGGAYTVELMRLGTEDDFLPGSFADVFGSIALGQAQTGTLEYSDDLDRFTATLEAGRLYTLSLEGSDTQGGTLIDPTIQGIYDSLDQLQPGSSDSDSGVGLNALLSGFTVAADGTYQIEVGAEEGLTGTYTLSLTSDGLVDDFLPGDAATIFGSIAVNSTETGSIETEGDRDRFQVFFEADQVYSISLTGSETLSGTLLDPELFGIFDSQNALLAGTTDNDTGPGLDASVKVIIETSGLYEIEVGSHTPSGIGGYGLSVDLLGSVDDFLPGSFADVFGSIALGETKTGTLEYSDDLDRFTTTLEAGRLYALSLEGADTQGGTLIDPTLLGIYDSLDQLQPRSSDSDSGTGLNALLSGFTVAADGSYQIEVGAEEGLTGTYSLSLTSEGLVDDFLPGSTATQPGSVSVDGSAVGEIEFDTDRDRFQVMLDPAFVYEVTLSGISGAGGMLADPEIFGLFDDQSELVDRTTDNDSGPSTDAATGPFTVMQAGTFEIEVGSHLDTGVGDYTVSVKLLGSVDDFLPGQFASLLGTVTVDGVTSGNIEVEGDRDRFEVELLAGVVYDISLEGVDTGGGSLINPELIGLFDSSGALVAGTSDGDTGVGANALVSGLTVAADGTYQIEAASAGDLGTGDYTLSVDFLGYLDDFLPGVAAGLGQLTPGAPSTGQIEKPGDTDRFTVTLNAGTTYQINLLGAGTNSGTLIDPFLVGAFSPGGSTPFSQTSDDDSGVGVNSLSNFTPPTSGDFEIEVSAFGDATGTYVLTIDDLGLLDDFTADPSTTGQIAPEGSASGRIDFPDDADWFRAELAADRLYRIELVSADGGGALSDPTFLGVHDSNGLLVPGTANDDGGEGSNSRLLFSTDQGGIHYLSAGGFLEDVGDYQLILTDEGAVVDDSDFDIRLEYTGPENYRPYFETAAARWENIITGDLPFASVEGFGFVDDILIEVDIVDIELVFDGVEQTIIAISGVLDQRPGDIGIGAALPTYSRVVVNTEEAERVINNLDDLAANAIGRALGFGALWEEFGLVQGSGSEAIYTGLNALREFSTLYGSANGNILLEDGADGALAREYWREATLGAEVMTPGLNYRVDSERPPNVIDNPISAITVGAMQDLGYEVNYNAADPYSLPRFASVQSVPAAAPPMPQPNLAPGQSAAALSAGYDTVPEGEQYFYVRPNTLSESPAAFLLTNANTQLISADGASALFLEGVTGDNLLIDLSGGFEKNQPATVSELVGTVSGAEIYSQSGTLLLRLEFSQKPVDIADLLSEWPGYAFDDENVVVVDAFPGTIARINPNGGSSEMSQIVVGASDDFVKGGDTAEMIDGGAANDTLLGEAGHDSLNGGPGDDILDGGTGTDMAIYSGAHTGYTLTLSPTETTLEDRRADGDGFDYLVDMELIDFATDVFSGPFSLQQFGGPTGLSAEEFQSFIELYIAYFNRAPDAVGLNFWGTAFANGLTLEEMAALFGPQQETLATYPEGTSNNDFATSVYNNVLGRTPDQSGIDFWVGLLDAGSVLRDQFILQVLQGAKSDLKPEEGQDFVDQQIADRAYLSNKTDIGAYFAVHKGMSDTGNAATAMALFTGTQDSIDAAVAAIDAFHQSALDPATGEFLMPVAGVLDDPFAIA